MAEKVIIFFWGGPLLFDLIIDLAGSSRSRAPTASSTGDRASIKVHHGPGRMDFSGSQEAPKLAGGKQNMNEK